MFDKLKQLNQLKELRDSLSREKKEVEKEGIKVVMNGKMEIEEIHLNAEIEQERQEAILKDCINQATREIQMEMARKMSQMPDLNL